MDSPKNRTLSAGKACRREANTSAAARSPITRASPSSGGAGVSSATFSAVFTTVGKSSSQGRPAATCGCSQRCAQ